MIVLTPPQSTAHPRRIELISENEVRDFVLDHEIEDRDFISEIVREALVRRGLRYVYFGSKKWKIMERFIVGEIKKGALSISDMRGEFERAKYETDYYG